MSNNLTCFPEFYIKNSDEVIPFKAVKNSNTLNFELKAIKASLKILKRQDGFDYYLTVTNTGITDFKPDSLNFKLGIDTYMVKYPDWNNKWFPNFFRCEKTHFTGCFMSPKGNALSVCCLSPIASYSSEYNRVNDDNYGHRICQQTISLLHKQPLPEHHPSELTTLKSGDEKKWIIHFDFCKDIKEYESIIAYKYKIPVIKAQSFTVPINGNFGLSVICANHCEVVTLSPSKKVVTDTKATDYGIYSVTAKSIDGFISTGYLYCRQSDDWYMKNSALQAFRKPPHATTHCESWYGFFSIYLYLKHFPDKALQEKANKLFDEVLPLMFDYNSIQPIVIPERIQNTSTFISLLVDRYESDPENEKASLILASHFGDWLMTKQKEDGAYYRNDSHYTCVIYPAKSMFELSTAEKKASFNQEYFKKASACHFESAARAVDNLVELLLNIGTEGEHTLEDGMLSCSVLQISYYALCLPKDKRKKYIDAAETVLLSHRCLEQNLTPDCRARGTTIRYWEAQYDILLENNVQTSPHGWSAWLMYGLYYLYLLTGKLSYLEQLQNGMGACLQLLSLNGDLRWAFAVDPYINYNKRITPDKGKPVTDAYNNIESDFPAYRGKFVDGIIGEEYLDMISGWFRTSDNQKLTGGFTCCPLILKDGSKEVDKQGGCCDNDVHEIFKCLEETIFRKAFIHECSDGKLICYNCKVNRNEKFISVECSPKTEYLCVNMITQSDISVGEKVYEGKTGVNIFNIASL